jgi:hypothetical protein
MTLFMVSPRQIPTEDRNWPLGVKITQVAEASLRVFQLAPSANPKNTPNSLDIFHSEKQDINNDTSIKQKDKKMYKNYTYVQEVTQATNLRVILLEVEPISRINQGISLKFNQTVSTLL